MKKTRFLIGVLLLAVVLCCTACGQLWPQVAPAATSDLALWEPTAPAQTTAAQTPAATENAEFTAAPTGAARLPENGTYTTKEDVALYLHQYGRLPGNFITKKEAEAQKGVGRKK